MEALKQGEKLMLLIRRDPRSAQEMAEALGVDKSYLPKLYKMDRLPRKPLARAQEVFQVSENYFLEDGNSSRKVSEPQASYASAELAHLQAELQMLRDENARLVRLLEQEKAMSATLAETLKNLSQRT